MNRAMCEPCGPEGKLWEPKLGTVPDAPSVPPPPPKNGEKDCRI